MKIPNQKDIIEFGYISEPVYSKWEREYQSLVIGINNADITGLIMHQIAKEPTLFSKGIELLKSQINIKTIIVYLPDTLSKEEQSKIIEALDNDIIFKHGIVNVWDYEENTLFHHPETILNISSIIGETKQPIKRWIFWSDKAKEFSIETTYRDVIKEFNIEEVKGLLFGGFRGKYISYNELDQPIGYWGNGEIIPIKPDKCFVNMSRGISSTLFSNTCGRCTFCREGFYQLKMIFSDIACGKSKQNEYEKIAELVKAIKEGSLCSYGISDIGLFEYLVSEENILREHIDNKRCENKACFQEGMRYAIRGDLCIGCGDCVEACPLDCIEGEEGFIYTINEFICDNCGRCEEGCIHHAIKKVSDEIAVGPYKKTVIGRYHKTTDRELR